MGGRDLNRHLRVLTLARDVTSSYGGAEKIAYEFARRLDPERFKSYVCTTRAAHPARIDAVARDHAALGAEGVEVLALNRPHHLSLTPFGRLYALLRREKIDIVHAHMPRASVPGSILARLAGVPVVISHEHGSEVEGKPVRRLLDRHVVARLSTRMLTVSEWDRRNLIDQEGLPPERIDVLPNGILPPLQTGRDVRAELGVPSGAPLIGAVGRMFVEKDYETLIRAVVILRQRFPELRCVIVGDGPHEQDLRALVDELALGGHVLMPGRRSDVPDVVGALDVAVLSSRREGSPLAILEYMALATPIVATAVGGVPELVQDDEHALLVPPSDPAAIAAAVQRLLDDRALAQRLGRAAQERQRALYDLDAVLDRLQALYMQLYATSRQLTTIRT